METFRKDMKRDTLKGKGPLSIAQVLCDPFNMKYFKQFCIQEMSVENLLFWLEVADYKNVDAPEYRRFVARKIHRKYIAENAPMAIAVPSKLRSSLLLTNELPTLDFFDKLRDSVESSMQMDIFPRFMESQLYNELVTIKFEERKVCDMSEFDLYRFLGAGGFGMVLLGHKISNNKPHAIKVIDKRILISQGQTHSIYREKEVLALVEHPFILSLQYAFQTEDHLCLVLDYIQGGNMYSDLMRGPYTQERAVFYAAQVVLATAHLHELNILYRDLKPDNVLLTLDGYIKLADMGATRGIADDGTIESGDAGTETASKTARGIDPAKARRMTITGTHGYRAPEVYERSYGAAADWWNVGLLILEMLTGDNPLRGDNRKESELLTKNKDIEAVLPAYMLPSSRDIVRQLLVRDPNKRLGSGPDGASAIKRHEFFRSIDFDKLLALEMPVPFEPDMDTEKPQRQPVPPTYVTQLDYFCQMVDYMKTSMAVRSTWPFKPEDQEVFRDFDYVSNKVFEDELTAAYNAQSTVANPFGGFGGHGTGSINRKDEAIKGEAVAGALKVLEIH